MDATRDITKNEFVQEVVRNSLAHLVRRQLTTKFGKLPKWVDGRLDGASLGQVKRWAFKVMYASTLEDVFEKEPRVARICPSPK